MILNRPFIGKVARRERRLDGLEYLHHCRAQGVSPVEGLLAVNPSLGKELQRV